MTEMLNIENIATDLLTVIINFLSVEDVSYLMQTNTFFNKSCLENPVIRIVGIKDKEYLQTIPKICYQSTQKLSCKLWSDIRHNQPIIDKVIEQLFESINSLKQLKVLGISRFESLLKLNTNNLTSIEIYNGAKPYFFGNFVLTKTDLNKLKTFKMYGTVHIDNDFIQFISKSKLEHLSFEGIVFPINKCGQMDANYVETAFKSILETLKSISMGFYMDELNENKLQHAVFKTLLLSPTICDISVNLMQSRYDHGQISEIEKYTYYFSKMRAQRLSLQITQYNQETMKQILSILPGVDELTLIGNNTRYLGRKIQFEEMLNFILKSDINISNELTIKIVSHSNYHALEILADVLEKTEKQHIAFKTLPKVTIYDQCGKRYGWIDIFFLIGRINDHFGKIANQMVIKLHANCNGKIENEDDWMKVVSLAKRMQICELQKGIECCGLYEDLTYFYKFKLLA